MALVLLVMLFVSMAGPAFAQEPSDSDIETETQVQYVGDNDEEDDEDDSSSENEDDEPLEYLEPPPRHFPEPMPGASLDDVRAQIDSFVAETVGRVSIAVVQMDSGPLLDLNPEERFGLASLSKLYILLAFLAGVEQQERDLTEDESFLLEMMITISDNYSAELLWEALGANEGLQAYLEAHELPVPLFNEDANWGAIGATAGEVAGLLQGLDTGRLTSEVNRNLSFDLLKRVVWGQRWGVSAGVHDGATVWLKNGWYPDEDGWRVNSAGLIRTDDAGSFAYAIVILTDGQPSHEYGIETIETIAGLINAALLPPAPEPELLVQSSEDGFEAGSSIIVEAMDDASAGDTPLFDITEGQT